MKQYKRSIKNLGKGLKGVAITAFGIGISPFVFPVGALGMAKGVKDIYISIQGNYIDNSMIIVEKNKVISKLSKRPNYYLKECMPTTKQFFEAAITKDKMNFLKLQEFNLLQGLDIKDKNGENIIYNTTTHAGNYRLLSSLEKSGMIKNLKKVPDKTSSLLLEKAFIANTKSKAKDKEYRRKRILEIKERFKSSKGIISKFKALSEEMKFGINKKTQMYKVSFEKTGKKFDTESTKNLLPFIFDENSNIDIQKYNVKYDEENNIKGVDYTYKYIMNELKSKSKERFKIKSNVKANEGSFYFIDSLKEQVNENIKDIRKEKTIDLRENELKNKDLYER